MPQGKASNRYNQFIAQVRPYAVLERHVLKGIARIADGSSGTAASCHPNIDSSGSILGMRARGHWLRTDRIVTANGFHYNTSQLVLHSDDDRLAALACRCGGDACYRYQMETGFRIPPSNIELLPDSEIVTFAAEAVARAKTEADQKLIPMEYAEDSVMVYFSIPICIDPEGLPEPGDPERNRILAENVLDWMLSAGIDPRDFKESAEAFSEYIDRDELLERRDLRATAPAPVRASSALAEAAANTIEMNEAEANAFA